ncbi:MAG TPA: hypothetical protein P5511_03745, partial [Candidatus Goldiibacteriota bacterium]|nr:hypothetical protein [Candidatus Goldiibacteriota bacterium]
MSAKKTRDLFLTAALVFFASAAGANSLPFDRGLSVRAAGSSSSLSPFIAGAQSSYINPALLAYAAKQEINCVYFNLFESSLVSSLSYALPL